LRRDSHVSQLLLETAVRRVSRNEIQLSVVWAVCCVTPLLRRAGGSCPQKVPHLWKHGTDPTRGNLHFQGRVVAAFSRQGSSGRTQSPGRASIGSPMTLVKNARIDAVDYRRPPCPQMNPQVTRSFSRFNQGSAKPSDPRIALEDFSRTPRIFATWASPGRHETSSETTARVSATWNALT